MLEALQLHAVGWLMQPANDERRKSFLPFLVRFFFFHVPITCFKVSKNYSVSVVAIVPKSAGHFKVIRSTKKNITLIFLLSVTSRDFSTNLKTY